MNREWYFISYNLPTEPSRIRVKVWRLLKRFGAINIQQSLWVLPKISGMDIKVKKLKEDIVKENGTMYLICGAAIDGETSLVSKFQSESEYEFKELDEYCDFFLKEMVDETAKKNFTFIELEENDEELKKLIKWFDRISKRDFFSCEGGKQVSQKLEKCKQEFDKFAKIIYEINGVE